MNSAEYYRALYERQGKILEETCASARFESHARSHQFLDDLETWIEILKARPEVVLLAKAKNELQAGLSLLTTGHYRYAFVSLRAALELALATLSHSVEYLSHRQWLSGRKDIVWASLIDPDGGVLSTEFCREFAPGLVDEAKHVAGLAKAAYRSCSEYVHGNWGVEKDLPQMFNFSQDLFDAWHSKAADVRFAMLFALAMRYLEEMDNAEMIQLEACLQDYLGHLPPIRNALANAKA